MAEAELTPGLEGQPVFDAGAFTILYAVDFPGQSFHLSTDISRRRLDDGKKTDLSRGESSQAELLQEGMIDDFAFALRRVLAPDEKEALEAMREVRREAVDRSFREELFTTERDYLVVRLKESGINPARVWRPKIGIRNIRQEGNTLFVDTRPVSYPVYSGLVNRGEEELDLLNLGESTGIAAALFTSDGMLIVQYRGPKNNVYGNVPGASVAGLLDGEFDEIVDEKGKRHATGTLKPIDNEYVIRNIRKEAQEELKVAGDDIQTNLVAVSHDEIKPHHELIFMATINKTSDELAEEGLIPDEEGGHDFKERYFAIDGTPAAIATLLTEVHCPLPATHSAAFFMAGYEEVIKRDGLAAAKEWARKTAIAIGANYEHIDQLARDFYDRYPVQAGARPIRSRSGYDANYLPEEQGLPNLLDELKRTGLVSLGLYEKMKMRYEGQIPREPNPEMLRNIPVAFAIDVDGFLTHPVLKKVTIRETIGEIAHLLKAKIPVALNTGRSVTWAYEQVGRLVEDAVEDRELLENFLIVGEKGTSILEYRNGEWHSRADSSFAMPRELKDKVLGIAQEEFGETMFAGEDPKVSMASPEMKKGVDQAVYKEQQPKLHKRLEELLAAKGLADQFEVVSTGIAVDVQHKGVGKGLGARQVGQWWKEKGVKPIQIVTAGDSPEDLAMADEFVRDGFGNVIFVFAGMDSDRDRLSQPVLGVKVEISQEKNEQGALELLRDTRFRGG